MYENNQLPIECAFESCEFMVIIRYYAALSTLNFSAIAKKITEAERTCSESVQ